MPGNIRSPAEALRQYRAEVGEPERTARDEFNAMPVEDRDELIFLTLYRMGITIAEMSKDIAVLVGVTERLLDREREEVGDGEE